MKKLSKFLRSWNVGIREVLSFIGIILTMVIVYMIMIISSIIYTLS